MSWYKSVIDFTEKSNEISLNGNPEPMNANQVQFAMEMMATELVELGQTVFTTKQAQEIIKNAVSKDLSSEPKINNDRDRIMEQCDALLDVIYYGLNCAAKQKFPLNEMFQEVHNANMSKAVNGKFQRREDGKIIKPANWQAPDLKKYIPEA